MRYVTDLQKRPDDSDIRVASSNVYFHYFSWTKGLTEEDKLAHAQLLADTLRDIDADVLLLQEVSAKVFDTKDCQWHERLDPMLEDYGYADTNPVIAPLPKSAADAGNPEGVNYTPILYKPDVLKLIDCGHKFYGSVAMNPDSFLSSSKSYTWALFERKTTGGRFVAFSTHLTYHGDAETGNRLRTEDANDVIAKMEELDALYPGIPMVLMGDCNCTVGSDPYRALEKKLVNAKTEAPKLVNENLSTIHNIGCAPGFGGIIDHVMVTPKRFDITQYQTFANLNVINMSDHVPVGIDFKL
ncbi:MAG: hypothetical protein E7641_06120 [Ruminococcaceae bacterium]|nr:hypothetical protein [Oscillospiraceae bacterium]